MIRIIEITVTQTRKINLGRLDRDLQYENIDLFLSAKAELTDGTLTEYFEARKQLSDALKADMEKLVKETEDDIKGAKQ